MVKPLAQFSHFLTEVREELKQVSWPSRDELVGSVIVVFVGVALLATFISVCNFLFSRGAQLLIYGQRARGL